MWNGNLLGYNIGYQELSETAVQTTPANSSQQYNMKTVDIGPDFGGHAVLSGLDMYTMYSVIVQAFNSRGMGPFSEPLTARTDEGGEFSVQLHGKRRSTRLKYLYSRLSITRTLIN